MQQIYLGHARQFAFHGFKCSWALRCRSCAVATAASRRTGQCAPALHAPLQAGRLESDLNAARASTAEAEGRLREAEAAHTAAAQRAAELEAQLQVTLICGPVP